MVVITKDVYVETEVSIDVEVEFEDVLNFVYGSTAYDLKDLIKLKHELEWKINNIKHTTPNHKRWNTIRELSKICPIEGAFIQRHFLNGTALDWWSIDRKLRNTIKRG